MDKIGKYEVVQQIGEGGFGVVYEGLDPFLKRRVAIKTCTSEAKELRERFFREAEIAGKLQHRHIVTVHDFGVHDEVPYLVQEFLSGRDLDSMIAARVFLPHERKVDILVDVARGLEHAHDKGVIHRDIKPANVRVLDDGSAKILDFGIAKLANVASHLTRTGMTVGTAAYLPPEQIRGAKVDHRADIFSFGVTAHELLAGRRPYLGDTISKLFYQILNEDPPSVRDDWPDCPPALADIVARCLRKDPDRRYPSFDEVIRDLSRVQTELHRQRETMGSGTTTVIPPGKQGLTSLGQALIDDDEVAGDPGTRSTGESAAAPGPGRNVVAWAAKLFEDGDPAAAREALRMFLTDNPEHPVARRLLDEVEASLSSERRQSFGESIDRALEAREIDRARRILDEAREGGLEAGEIESLAERIRSAEESASADVTSEIETKAAEPLRLARAGDFVRALRLTEALLRHYDEHPRLLALRNEIETSRSQEIARLQTEIRTALRNDSADEAEELLEELRRKAPESEELSELARAFEEHRAVDERIGSIVERVEGLISEGHLEAAFAALKAAETQHGSPPFAELQQKVRRLRRARLDQQVRRKVEEGRSHLEQGNLADAVRSIEEALAIEPENEDALSVLKAAQSQLRSDSPPAATVSEDDEPDTVESRATVRLSAAQIREAERIAAAEARSVEEAPEPPPEKPVPSPATTTAPAPPVPAATTPPARPAKPPSPPPPTPTTPTPGSSAPTPAERVTSSASPPSQPTAPKPSPPPAPASAPSSTPSPGAAAPPRPRPAWLLPAGLAAGLGIVLLGLLWVLFGSRETEAPSEPPPTQVAQQTTEPAPQPPPSATEPPDQSPAPEVATIEPETGESVPDPVETTVPPAGEEVDDEDGALDDPGSELPDEATRPEIEDEATSEPVEVPGPQAETPPTRIVGDGALLVRNGVGVENASLDGTLEPNQASPSDAPTFALLYVLVEPSGTASKVVSLPGGTTDRSARREATTLATNARYRAATRDGIPGRQWTVVRVDFP